ncbi:hypothetical protein HMI01_18710 [Halolactibacillus miurensis]|uniref:Glycosyl hydrolase family 65, N-terminal domain n=1 Tax=Halolactibacillus miurensis TaxID=306541 RepID=A0A1I6U0E9_9BACI|nr:MULTISPECIES: glycoside hydrolase N-terminal domain-containing protein [Halolactibacillus]GEM04883.1 hypothetical protein HMI01_18710 [Halolactibacillus miurensis]SFS94969.1 Glycosyl hydrolase family 65, N-terminal domain [Halolactibacillus miurensis]
MTFIEKPTKGIWHDQPANNWEEGLVLGNGKMGMIVFGDPERDTVIGNHGQLFLPTKNQQPVPDLSDLFGQLRLDIQLFGYDQAIERYEKEALRRGYQGLTMSNPYVPSFECSFDFHHEEEPKAYRRQLNYQTGEATVTYEHREERIVTQSFVSRRDDLIVYRVRNLDGLLDVTMIPTIYDKEELSGAFFFQNNQFKWHYNYTFKEGGYTVNGQFETHGGKVATKGNHMRISDTKEIVFLFRIEPTLMSPPLCEKITDYHWLLSRHRAIHQELFDRVQLTLKKDKKIDDSFTALMVDAQNKQTLPLTLLEKIYDASRYMYIASSGQVTPNLQGIWSGTFSPAWSGDYTFDTNVQLSIAQALSGHFEEGLFGFFDLIDSLLPDFRENARRYYGCRGIFSSIHASSHGHHIHWNKDWPLLFYTAGAGWLGHWYYQYYRYTQDTQFLKHRCVPYLEEVVLFFQDFLIEDPDGTYRFSPSYSAENGCADNATQDIAVLKEVLTNLIASYHVLDVDEKKIETLTHMKEKLPAYRINEAGALKEWLPNEKEENYNHRHFSHLYPIFQSREFTEETAPELFKAARIAFDKRREAWLDSDEGDTTSTHGRMHSALLATQFHLPDMIKDIFMMLINHDCFYPSLMMSHYNNREVFNVDGNGAFPQVIHEMLADYHHHTLYLLQALPTDIEAGEIQGLQLPDMMEVLNLKWDLIEKRVKLSLVSRVRQAVQFKLPLYPKAKIHNHLANGYVAELNKDQPVIIEIEL